MERIEVLDHGYVGLVEKWGSDEAIIRAARMSTDKGFQGWGPRCGRCKNSFLDTDGITCLTEGCQGGRSERIAGDEKLLKYLWDNAHSTPFEFGGLVLEIQAPIFVFREHHRHRTQSYAELSARYAPLPDFNYVPTVERCLISSKENKQAGSIKGAEILTDESAKEWIKELEEAYAHVERVYQNGLKRGIPKEVARVPVPVGRYSRMRASANLRNWLGFLTLRMAPNAQWEIRQFANAIGAIIAQEFPKTWELFVEKSSTPGRP